MSYHPVAHGAHIPLDNIELDTRYDPAAYAHAQQAPSQVSRGDDESDKKPLFRREGSKKSASGVGSRHGAWPVQAQRVAAITPLRAGIMVFDAVLASTPIMFVGMYNLFLVGDFGIWKGAVEMCCE